MAISRSKIKITVLAIIPGCLEKEAFLRLKARAPCIPTS
jgi:hypothetical protein